MADSSSSDSSPDRAPPLHVMADSSDSDSSPDRAPPLHVMADSSDSDSSDRAPPPRATADSSSDGDGAPDAFLAASSSGSSDGDDAPRGAAAEARMDGVDAYGVLQRDDGAATGDALSAFAGVHGRDAAVLAVADAWAARSPHLGELCRAFRARPALAPRRWLAKLATRDVWLAWAARGEPRPAHRRVLRALDATEPSQRAALAGAVAAAPPLRRGRRRRPGALTATRPWDAKPGEPCAPRALAGCDALGAVLAAGGGRLRGLDRAARPRDVAAAALARCLPPEDVLSKKDLGRGLMHGDPAANRAALVLVLRVLDRFAAERGAAVEIFGGCSGAAERPPVKAILEVAKRLLEGEDFDLEPHRRREKPGRRLPEAVAAGRFDFANSARGFGRGLAAALLRRSRASRAVDGPRLARGDDPAARRCRDRVVDAVADGEAPVAARRAVLEEALAREGLDGTEIAAWVDALAAAPVGASFGAAWDAARDHRGAFEDVRRAAAGPARGRRAARDGAAGATRDDAAFAAFASDVLPGVALAHLDRAPLCRVALGLLADFPPNEAGLFGAFSSFDCSVAGAAYLEALGAPLDGFLAHHCAPGGDVAVAAPRRRRAPRRQRAAPRSTRALDPTAAALDRARYMAQACEQAWDATARVASGAFAAALERGATRLPALRLLLALAPSTRDGAVLRRLALRRYGATLRVEDRVALRALQAGGATVDGRSSGLGEAASAAPAPGGAWLFDVLDREALARRRAFLSAARPSTTRRTTTATTTTGPGGRRRGDGDGASDGESGGESDSVDDADAPVDDGDDDDDGAGPGAAGDDGGGGDGSDDDSDDGGLSVASGDGDGAAADGRYDPRFLLPVGFAALRNAGAADAARLARRAHEGGFLASLPRGVGGATGASARGPSSRACSARPRGRRGGPAGAAAGAGRWRGAPRLPALAARRRRGCLAALDSPERDGYAARTPTLAPALRPWRGVPLLKEAGIKESRCGFVAVKPFTSLTPESARAKRERRWAMRLLREGCADDASGRLLRNSRALPRLFAHVDCVGTGGWDEELGRLAFHGNVPPGCASLLDEPKRTLRRVKRGARDCLEDAHAAFGAALATRAARRACFHEVGATPWLGTHVFMEPTGEGKNWAKVARYAGWLAAIFAEAARDDDVLERAPLFFTDLSSQTRKVLDCVTDADDARVLPEGYERAPRRRTADLAPLAYASGQLTRRETRTEADARRREADDVFSDEDVDYPDLDLGEVVAGIRKQLEVEKRHRERDAEDRDAPESSDDDEAAPAAADDARCAAFAATDALLLLHYRLSNRLKPPPPADETDLAPANLDFGYVVKDCYFYVFGMDGAPAKRASTPLDAEILALVVANRCELGELHLGAFYGDDGDDGRRLGRRRARGARRKLAELDADDSAAAERAEGRRRDLADCAHAPQALTDICLDAPAPARARPRPGVPGRGRDRCGPPEAPASLLVSRLPP
ncbi:hypothetical protein JL721_11609 [Aureococcus anophagefferens]|nr:hypothetical protein JL721_11609 [Aureococcus anophagefferens]